MMGIQTTMMVVIVCVESKLDGFVVEVKEQYLAVVMLLFVEMGLRIPGNPVMMGIRLMVINVQLSV